MKHIRGFGYVGDDVDYDIDALEADLVELEHGIGWENVTPGQLKVKAYNCPRCKLKLFEADVSLHGVIFIKCRRCRREVAIETAPIMQRIGYINSLRKETTHHDSRS